MPAKRRSRAEVSYAEDGSDDDSDFGERQRPRMAPRARADAATSSMYTSTATDTVRPFIQSLWRLCTEAENSALVQWNPEGTSITVLDQEAFAATVLPRYFKTSEWTSFQRNLNLYGFHCPRAHPGQKQFEHPDFLRGRPDLLPRIRRPGRSTAPPEPVSASIVPTDLTSDVVSLVTALRHSDARMKFMEAVVTQMAQRLTTLAPSESVFVNTRQQPPYVGLRQSSQDDLHVDWLAVQRMCDGTVPLASPLPATLSCDWQRVWPGNNFGPRLNELVTAVAALDGTLSTNHETEGGQNEHRWERTRPVAAGARPVPVTTSLPVMRRIPQLQAQASVRDDFTNMLAPETRDTTSDTADAAAALARMGSFQPEASRRQSSVLSIAPSTSALPPPVAASNVTWMSLAEGADGSVQPHAAVSEVSKGSNAADGRG